MASLDLGTLIAHIKVEGAATAKSVLGSVSNAMGSTSKSATGATSGVGSFTSAITSGLGNVSLFGTNLGTLASAFGGSEVAGVAMGTALGGVCTAGVLACVSALKAGIQACGEFIVNATKVGIGFQAQMSKVQAISGESAGGLNTLTAAARQFGKDTVFSATEVAQAMEYTALAGYNTQETISALPGVLNLAAASDMDLARASDIVTDYLTAFGMEVDQSTHLVDVMAYTMSHTNTNTDQLGESYKACAATCNSFGVNVEEASAWLGVMANAGYKGEQSGTALNAVLARMYGETKTTNDALLEYGLTMYDANGKAKNFTQVMGEIQEKMKGMTDQQRNVFMKAVAGTNQLSKFATMVGVSADEVKGLTTELENSAGTSEKMVETMTNNISGLQKSIGSKVESIKLSIFSAFEPLLTDVLQIVDGVLNAVSTLLEPIGSVVGAFLDIFSPIFDGLNRIVSILSSLIGDLIEPFKNLFVANFGAIGDAIQFVVDIIVGLVELIADFVHPIIDILSTFISLITQIGGALKTYILDRFPDLKQGVDEFVQGFKDGFLLIPNIVLTAVNRCIDAINTIPGVTIEKVDYLTESYANAMLSMGEGTADFVGSAANEMEEYKDAITEITDANYTNFEEMYDAIQTLDDETYGRLKENADGYMSEYQLQLDALSEFESEKTREMMKTWEKTHEKQSGTMEYYLEKAKYQAVVEEALANKTAKTKEEINTKYTTKVQTELEKQKALYEKHSTNNYSNDYKEFATNEEKKTKKYNEELEKRKSGSGFLGSLGTVIGKSLVGVSGFANGTASVSSTGVYKVGEFGPEYVTLPKGAGVIPNNSISGFNDSGILQELRSLRADIKLINGSVSDIPRQQKNLNQVWGW